MADTAFAAVEDLSDDEKATCESLRVVHTIEASQRLQNPNPSPEDRSYLRRQAWRRLVGCALLVTVAALPSGGAAVAGAVVP